MGWSITFSRGTIAFCSRSAVAASILTSFVSFLVVWAEDWPGGDGDDGEGPELVGPAHATARVAIPARIAMRTSRLMRVAPAMLLRTRRPSRRPGRPRRRRSSRCTDRCREDD